jgi:hypothetical protein
MTETVSKKDDGMIKQAELIVLRENIEKEPYPPYLIVYTLLLCIPRRASRIKLPRAKILVQNLKVGIALQHCRVNRRQHDIPRIRLVWFEVRTTKDAMRVRCIRVAV